MAILVYAESANGKYKKAALEAVSYAKALADKAGQTVTAITINTEDASDILYTYGASKVLKINGDGFKSFSSEVFAAAIASKIDGEYVVLVHTNDGGTIAPLLAVQTNATLVTNIIEAPSNTAPFTARRKAFSGKGIMTVEAGQGLKIITVLQNAYGLHENPVSGTEETVSVDAGTPKVKVEGSELAGSKLDLKEAEFVVSAGRGMKGPENWGMIEELAGLLNAATACSKPVADIGWRPHGEHVGQTGKAISPKLYIAVGISGAIQHLAGVGSSKTIVVINTDPEAPFFKAADYGIVGDAFDVVPKFIEKLKAFQGK